MLLVIFGAGASYDSLASDVREQMAIGDEEHRPPLARELFEDRRSFGKVLDTYPQAAVLIRRLRQRVLNGVDLEQELESYQEQAKDYPPFHRHLMAVRFYLQEILWTCGSRWLELSHGQTNYGELLLRLDQWRHSRGESLCFVTFNYDVMLDNAAIHTLGADLSSVEAFASDERYRFLKLHGSVNWGRRVRSPGGTHYSKAQRAREVLIDNAATLDISDDYVLRTPEQTPADSSPYPSILMPAITLPVMAKSSFECPPSHLEALESCIRTSLRILVIGWRGMERHFLRKLSALPGMAPAVTIVGATEEGTAETARNLVSAGLSATNMRHATEGFSNFIGTDLLEQFLDADVQSWGE